MRGEDSAAMAAICVSADIPASRTVQTLPLTIKTDSLVHSQRLQTSESNFYPLVKKSFVYTRTFYKLGTFIRNCNILYVFRNCFISISILKCCVK